MLVVKKKNSKVAQVLHNKIELTSQKTFSIAIATSMAAVCQMQAINKGPLRRDSFDDNKDFV